MNKIFILSLLVTIASILVVSAIAVGNPDTECQANGFSFGIAKFECGNTTAENGSQAGSYDIDVEWDDCWSVNWTADPAVDGVLTKEATFTFVHPGGTNGTTEQWSDHDISHVTFCGNTPIIPEFGTVIGILTMVSAIGIFLFVRRN